MTSRYFVAEPWLATTWAGGATRLGIWSLELGEVAGFSTTVPNCEKAVGVSSSMGMRMEGLGMEVGMAPVFSGWLHGGQGGKEGTRCCMFVYGCLHEAVTSINGGRIRRAKIQMAIAGRIRILGDLQCRAAGPFRDRCGRRRAGRPGPLS